MMDNGFDGRANVAEQLADLLFPASYAPFGKVDLRVVCEEIQEASPVGGNPRVVESLQIFERNRLSLLVRHCMFGERHRRFPLSLATSSTTNPCWPCISSLSSLFSEDQADRWALSN
jgi:hypothetical protein